MWEGGLLVWHVKYQTLDQPDTGNLTRTSRLRHRLNIKKDDVQAVLPISKVDIACRYLVVLFMPRKGCKTKGLVLSVEVPLYIIECLVSRADILV